MKKDDDSGFDEYPPARFRYVITPAVVPVSESTSKLSRVTWMIAVYNDTGTAQSCKEITFQFPVGPLSGDLITDPGSIDPGPALGTEWSIRKDGEGVFLAIPNTGNDGLAAGESIAFIFRGATINEIPGSSTVMVRETSDQPRSLKLDVVKNEAKLAITSFTANPIQVDPGESTRLDWTATGAVSAVLSWSGNSETVSTDGFKTLTLIDTTPVTLTISGAGGSVWQTITLSVLRAKILSFSVEPKVVAQYGPATLRWKIQNATKATVDPGGVDVTPVEEGSLEIKPANSLQYVLEARGAGKQNDDSRVVFINVESVQIQSLTASPETIDLRQPTIIAWNTAWATSVVIEPDIGTVGTSGSISVNPQCDTTYKLTATGLAGPIFKTVQVKVRQTSLLPVGTIKAFAGPIPTELELLGWMVCDGRALASKDFRCLHNSIGTAYGTTGEGFFNLPDFRGVFLRGVSDASERDPNRASRTASKQGSAVGNKVGSFQEYGTAPPKNPFRMGYSNLDISRVSNDSGCQSRPASYTDSDQWVEAASGGDKESRPDNKYVYYIIKYKFVTEANNYVVPPVASIVSYAGVAKLDPAKWLPCDGRKVTRNDQPALVAAIGNSHGDAGPDEVHLPDYRGYFLRGVDGASHRDPDAGERGPPNPDGPDGRKGNKGDAVGSRQAWATGLAHNALTTNFPRLPRDNAGEQVDGSLRRLARLNSGSTAIDLTGGSGGDEETRPRNMSVEWYIRVA
jgi:microcystin-dependent protein